LGAKILGLIGVAEAIDQIKLIKLVFEQSEDCLKNDQVPSQQSEDH
jgi:hypothetical protein